MQRVGFQGRLRRDRAAISTRSTSRAAFTLLELLVVIGIMALMATLVAPSLKRMRTVDVLEAANRQLLDDLALARQRAMANRATVYVVFLNPGMYAQFTRRSAGDQPGRDYPRFLTSWTSLPDGVFVATNKFDWQYRIVYTNVVPAWIIDVPPFETNAFSVVTGNGVFDMMLDYVAFDYQGRLMQGTNRIAFDSQMNLVRSTNQLSEEIIPLARGHLELERDPATGLMLWDPTGTWEDPPGNSVDNFNLIDLDWLTGRARVVRPEIHTMP